MDCGPSVESGDEATKQLGREPTMGCPTWTHRQDLPEEKLDVLVFEGASGDEVLEFPKLQPPTWVAGE